MSSSGKGKPRVGILKADGTNCEIETAYAFELAGARAEVLPMNRLRAGEARLAEFDALAVPGGFSYGDDVVSGKILAVEMMSFLADELADFVAAGKPVLGICNGFQVLVRTGLLPFAELGEARASLVQNQSGHFECRWSELRRSSEAAIVAGLPERIQLPVANGEGRFFADPETLERIEQAGLVALRYVDAEGRPTEAYPDNPNGSMAAIAGLCDPSGRILGLMPHPERFVHTHQHPDWRGRVASGRPDGLVFFEQVIALA